MHFMYVTSHAAKNIFGGFKISDFSQFTKTNSYKFNNSDLKVAYNSPWAIPVVSDIDPLQLRHVFWGISVYYPEVAILVYRHTLASYAVSVKSCPASLVSVYTALFAYTAIPFYN